MQEKETEKAGFFRRFFRFGREIPEDKAFTSLYSALLARFEARMQRSDATREPFIFPSSEAANTLSRRPIFRTANVLRLTFALMVLAIAGVFLFLPRAKPGMDIAYEHIGNFEVIHAPRRISHPNGSSIVLKTGKVFVKKISEGKSHPVLHLYADKITADFDFKSRIDFSLEGPDINLKVLGTAFSLNWNQGKNEVFVTRGKVSVANLASGETRNLTIGQGIVVQSGKTCTFSGEKACEIGKDVVDKNRLVQGKQVIVRLTGGALFDGTITQETENEITLMTAAGEKKISKSDIEDRLDKSWLKRKR